ncbi:hypothetical protein HN51_050127 [Arachis hypogaea]|uniref:KIB1-4 beta-propeller domain-containing protein n=1 Tax=Arachis hypogaea TaxID=3818 RepID=A0A444YCL5_ARAHY|nr:F-box protein At2g26160 [Arachis ipaensis]XP_025668733.1 F-box protein At2g26160-like [Arachis hypogaea]QHN91792.1 Putative F-box protein [Arachis hypogaea]RYQ99667.1 hypothetical protein Ahy_B07g087639 [Arachis hypogaea]
MATIEKTVAGQWSNLPKELLSLIANHHLHSVTIHILRIRATCTSWRSAIPPPLPPPLSHTIFGQRISIRWSNFTVTQTSIFYRLHYQPSSISSSSEKGWIIMVGNSTSNPVQLLDPFTDQPLSETVTHPYDCKTPPKLLNLCNFRLVELFEAYALTQFVTRQEGDSGSTSFTPFDLVKAILFPNSTSQTFDESSRMVFALYSSGRLSVSRIDEDEGWTSLDAGNSSFDDVILRNGQLYAVDKCGTIFWVDCSTLKLVQFSPILCDFQAKKKKRLVDCNGSLYLVDIDTDIEKKEYYDENNKAIKVYKLDMDHGWLNAENLGNVVFVLGASCSFSLSVEDYHGCEANCIYLYSRHRVRAFSLETCKFKRPKLFWPCPSLFESRFNL